MILLDSPQELNGLNLPTMGFGIPATNTETQTCVKFQLFPQTKQPFTLVLKNLMFQHVTVDFTGSVGLNVTNSTFYDSSISIASAPMLNVRSSVWINMTNSGLISANNVQQVSIKTCHLKDQIFHKGMNIYNVKRLEMHDILFANVNMGNNGQVSPEVVLIDIRNAASALGSDLSFDSITGASILKAENVSKLELTDLIMFNNELLDDGSKSYRNLLSFVKTSVHILNSRFSTNTVNGSCINGIGSRINVKYSEFYSNMGFSGTALSGDSTHLFIEHTNFTYNHALSNGSAIHLINSDAFIDRSRFEYNQAGTRFSEGGTIFLQDTLYGPNHTTEFQINVMNTLFHHNNGSTGGALYILNHHNVGISGCRFQRNKALYSGGSVYLMGSATIKDTWFYNNRAHNVGGGAIYMALCEPNSYPCSLHVTGCNFTANRGHCAASISAHADVTVTHSTFLENNATHIAGGILADAVDLNFDNVTFDNNFCMIFGAVLHAINSRVNMTNMVIKRHGNKHIPYYQRTITTPGHMIYLQNTSINISKTVIDIMTNYETNIELPSFISYLYFSPEIHYMYGEQGNTRARLSNFTFSCPPDYIVSYIFIASVSMLKKIFLLVLYLIGK